MHDIINKALEIGFTTAIEIKAFDVVPHERIRALCTPEKCSSYGTNHVCPPGCGSLDKCREVLGEYEKGLLLQIKYENVDTSSMEVCERLSKEFGQRVIQLRDTLLAEYPKTLALATGGCRECEKCTYPENPCRKPNIRRGSLSAFGIDVGELCRKYDTEFAFTEGTLFFTACMLIK
ncbi:MAG: DUF2284 domain-containing protein [Oscillospiraceae bacterium]|nr:DUF2284 domain-containing protein [Oscillospiraceae bacterium]